jgi:hypothetical protein
VLRQVESVTTRLLALVGFQAVLHQTAMSLPLMLVILGNPGPELLAKHEVGGLAFNV